MDRQGLAGGSDWRCAVAGLLVALAIALAGCSSAEQTPAGAPESSAPLAGTKLVLTVVDDPGMANVIERLQGEWVAQSGGELTVRQASTAEVSASETLASDALIVPSWLVGPLAQRKQLHPLPSELRTAAEGPWTEIFELLRMREATWGSEVVAVPLGSPVFVCYYRPDLLETAQRRPPQTWADYQSLALKLAKTVRPAAGHATETTGSGGDAKASTDRPAGEKPRDWYPCVEPLGPGWAGWMLLARAAPYAKHPSNYSALFDIHSMEPLIAGAPFVRALQELAEAAKLGPADQLGFTPDDCRRLFWEGRVGMAVTWPTAAVGVPNSATAAPSAAAVTPAAATVAGESADPAKSAANPIPVAFVELPGAAEVFDVGGQNWSRREAGDLRVPLLSVAGRVGVVSAKSAHYDAALRLLNWLSNDPNGTAVAKVSPSTTLFRSTQLQAPAAWVEPPAAAAAPNYAATVRLALTRQESLSALRIPGRAEYLGALDKAVHQVVRGEKTPREALIEAASQWREITTRLGIEEQRSAYRNCLGVE